MNLWSLLERAASLWPERAATVAGAGAARTERFWREVRGRCAGLAARFTELGAVGDQRVAVLCANSPAYLETYLACAGAGAVLCPLNTRLGRPELEAILEQAAPRVLVADAAHRELARVLLGPGTHLVDAEAERAARPTWRPVTRSADDLAQLYFTSGTTGRPKGVMLTHGNVAAHALAAVAELRLDEADVWAHVAPMFHLADAWATFAVTWVGGRHVFLPHFEAGPALDLLREESVTITNLVPTMLVRVVEEARSRGLPPRSLALRLLLSGGAPIAPEVVARIEEVLGCPYAQTYGMTETSPYLTISLLDGRQRDLPLEEQRRLRARTGRPFLGIELEVVDDAGAPVPRDDRSVGEIRVRGAHVSPGYWNRPEETAAAFRDGWLYTGDLAVVDAAGSVNIVDRRKDMILTGGENVYSIEVENALHEHPAVLEAAVFARPDPEWGERVCAAVVLRPGASASAGELVEHCRTLLAGYKCPRELELRAELPRTGSGKITKRALREEGARPGSAIAGAAPPPDGV